MKEHFSIPHRPGSRSGLYALLTAVLLAITGLALLAAQAASQWFFSWYPAFSQAAMAFLAVLNGWLPFALWELLLLPIGFWAVFTFVRMCRRRIGLVQWLWGLILFVVFLLSSFTLLWGLNHYRDSVASLVGLEVTEYSTQALQETTLYMLEQANALAEQVTRDEAGVASFASFAALAQEASAAWKVYAADQEGFYPSAVRPKPMLLSKLMNHLGLTGIIIVWTSECSVSTTDPDITLPFTMCHELAHRQAVAAEEDANFLSFLVCSQSDSLEFQYSGYYSAFVYCYNALYKVNRTAAAEVWAGLSAELQRDINNVNTFYAQYETPVKETAQKVNDTYLKSFSEEAGVQSYGQVVDLLIAWYQAQA